MADEYITAADRVDRLRRVPIAEIGRREAVGTHGGTTTVPVYPEGNVRLGRGIADWRVHSGLGLREAARLLDMTPLDLAAIERGAAWFIDTDWAYAAITHAWGPRP